MGKGYNNYMTKKFFHPGSKENIKRVWMAEEKAKFEKTKQEEMLAQYQREQETLENRAILGDEKAKMGLSFMYDPPPGTKEDRQKEDDEPEYKFEWQRQFNAPRESYAKGDETIRDQPFGIEVRNVRCIKCHKWGHVNTDRICPLFGQNITAEPPQPGTQPKSIIGEVGEDGIKVKNAEDPRQQKHEGESDEDDPETKFLKSLTPKQKKKLLRKLDKAAKKKEKKKKSRHSSSDSDSSDSEEEEIKHRKKDLKHEKSRHASRDSDEKERDYKKKDRQASRDSERERDYKKKDRQASRDIERERDFKMKDRHALRDSDEKERDYKKKDEYRKRRHDSSDRDSADNYRSYKKSKHSDKHKSSSKKKHH